MIIPDVTKIAILRAGALGDFIVTLPAIDGIRKAYPQAEIVLMGKPWMKDFLKKNRTPIDRVEVIPISKGLREEEGEEENTQVLEDFFLKMQREKFDIAMHFQGKGISANPFIRRLGAKTTAGLTCPEAEKLTHSVEFYYYQSEVVSNLEVAALIGADLTSLEPKISILPEDDQEAETFFINHKIENNPFVVLHPFSTDVRREWPVEQFAETGDTLAESGYQVVFSGSEKDIEGIETIRARMKSASINGGGQISLGGLIAVLAKSELVIASDTGPLHLARACGAKTIGIYWAPNLINWGPLLRKKHRPVISWKMECPLCGVVPNNPYPFEPQGVTCTHNISFVKEVKVEEVLREAEVLTARRFSKLYRKEEERDVVKAEASILNISEEG